MANSSEHRVRRYRVLIVRLSMDDDCAFVVHPSIANRNGRCGKLVDETATVSAAVDEKDKAANG